MKNYLFLIILLAVFTFSGFSLADDTENDEIKDKTSRMNEVVVTATRNEELINKVPSNVTIITSEDINESGANSVVDLLENLANIHVRTYSGNPAQAIIDLRGFGGENPYGKTLVLLDGRRLNRPDMSSINWLQVPLELVERVEIVRGSNAVLYGDSAIGGVINIITKKGAPGTTVNYSSIFGENSSHIERGSLIGSYDKFSYSANFENQNNDGWRDRTAFNSIGGGINIGYDFSDYFSISSGISYNKTEFEMPGALTKEELRDDREQYQPKRNWGGFLSSPAHDKDEAENEYWNANLLGELSLQEFGALELSLSYGKKRLFIDMPSGWEPGQYNYLKIDTYGISPKYILDIHFYDFQNKFIAGIDAYYEKLVLKQYLDLNRHDRAWKTEVNKNTVGGYFRNEFYPFDTLILGFGYRYEEATFSAEKTEYLGSFFASPFSQKVKKHTEDAYDFGITWLPTKNIRIYGKYSTLYRYPFTDEHVNYYGLNDGFNDDIEPETGKSYEIGGNYSPIENLNLSLTLFQIDLKDEIAWDNNLNQNINMEETRHRGVETSLSYQFNNLIKLYGNYSFHDATYKKGPNKDKQIPLVPKHHLTTGLDISLPYDLHVCPEMVYVSSSYLGNDYNNSSEKIEGYSIFDLYIRYKPKFDIINFSAFAGVKNIVDKHYETSGYENDIWTAPDNTYYPSGGREFIAGFSIGY